MRRTGEIEERVAALLEAMHTGRLTQARVEAAAAYGHEAARLLFPQDGPLRRPSYQEAFALLSYRGRRRIAAELAQGALDATTWPHALVTVGGPRWHDALRRARQWGQRAIRAALSETEPDELWDLARAGKRYINDTEDVYRQVFATARVGRLMSVRCQRAVLLCAFPLTACTPEQLNEAVEMYFFCIAGPRSLPSQGPRAAVRRMEEQEARARKRVNDLLRAALATED